MYELVKIKYDCDSKKEPSLVLKTQAIIMKITSNSTKHQIYTCLMFVQLCV